MSAQFTIPDAKAIQGAEGTITKVSSNDVSVKTVKGVITLHGKVASAADQQAAEEIAA